VGDAGLGELFAEAPRRLEEAELVPRADGNAKTRGRKAMRMMPALLPEGFGTFHRKSKDLGGMVRADVMQRYRRAEEMQRNFPVSGATTP
jgi:hypothetical protein